MYHDHLCTINLDICSYINLHFAVLVAGSECVVFSAIAQAVLSSAIDAPYSRSCLTATHFLVEIRLSLFSPPTTP